MMLELLKADLKRYWGFAGRGGEPGASDVFKAVFSPRFTPVFLYRASFFLNRAGWRIAAKFFSLLNFLLFGIEMAVTCEAGPGLCFAHTYGIVVGARSIGRDALIYHEVTIGAKSMDVAYTPEKRPLVGDGVTIGAGAKVLGGITLGDGCIIGANAVVTRDIPAGAVAGGIPARVLKMKDGHG